MFSSGVYPRRKHGLSAGEPLPQLFSFSATFLAIWTIWHFQRSNPRNAHFCQHIYLGSDPPMLFFRFASGFLPPCLIFKRLGTQDNKFFWLSLWLELIEHFWVIECFKFLLDIEISTLIICQVICLQKCYSKHRQCHK